MRSSREGRLKWRGVVCILGHFMKKGCNHGSKPRGGLNYAWLNKAQGYQRAMSQQTPASLWSSRLQEDPTQARKKKKKKGKKPKNKQEHRNAAPDKSPDLCYDKRSHFETKLLRGLQNTGQKKTFPFTRGQMIHRGVYVTNKPSREARWPVKPSTATRAEHRKRLVS